MKSRRRRLHRSRSGFAIMMVVLLLSVTIGLSYAMVRFQNSTIQVERNSDRQLSARQAALTGMAIGLKKMSANGWAGVGSTLSGAISREESYRVTYTAGDSSLTIASPDYADLPYRVTVQSVGTAADPADLARASTYTIQAVMRLVPRALASEPSGWSDMASHVIYQYSIGTCMFNVPFRAEGKVRFNWFLSFCTDYAWSSSARLRYCADLQAMRLAGNPDWRPFNGPIYLPYWWQSAGIVSLLNTTMGIPTVDMAINTSLSPPNGVQTSYRLYPGGPTYYAQNVPQECKNQSWGPDPATNPLGVFLGPSETVLKNNATIRGTLVVQNAFNPDVEIDGNNVQLLSQDLPALYGTTTPIRLPVVMVQDDFRIRPGSQGMVQGLVSVANDFEIQSDNETKINVALQARLIAKSFLIRGRSDWNKSSSWWSKRYSDFMDQLLLPDGNPYFPSWLSQNHGLNPNPRILVQPETTSVRYYWTNLQNPIYAPHPSDGGLRWDIVRWTDNP